MTVSLFITEQPDPADVEIVDQGLSDFNAQEAQLAQVRDLCVFARGPQGEVAAGAVGRTWGQCAEVQQLWVSEGLRRQGLGRRVMAAFEQAAVARGCTLVYLDTFSFQAPDFYERLGYVVVLATAGFTPTISKFRMHKRLGLGLLRA